MLGRINFKDVKKTGYMKHVTKYVTSEMEFKKKMIDLQDKYGGEWAGFVASMVGVLPGKYPARFYQFKDQISVPDWVYSIAEDVKSSDMVFLTFRSDR